MNTLYKPLLKELNVYCPRDISHVILQFYRTGIEDCCSVGDYIQASNKKELISLCQDGEHFLVILILDACKENYPEILKLLLDEELKDILQKDTVGGYQVIREVCYENNMECLKILISRKFCTPDEAFYWACETDHLEMVKYLVSCGADDFNYGMSRSLLGIFQNKRVMKYLYDKGGSDWMISREEILKRIMSQE